MPPKPVVVDRTLECMVCGKEFPRGPNDLARHSAASTLQHLVSSSLSDVFPHKCSKCGLCFTSDDHLHMHKDYSSCGKVITRSKPVGPKTPSKSIPTDPSESASVSGDLEDRTLECMICGKLFPRGPVDLARHAQASTLRHLTADTHSPSYSHQCMKCNLYFTTEDHLAMHVEMSTCNPDMVWPDNHATTAGLRAISRLKYSKIYSKKTSVGARDGAESAEEGSNVDDLTFNSESDEKKGDQMNADGSVSVGEESGQLSERGEQQMQSIKMEVIGETSHPLSSSLSTSTSELTSNEEQQTGRVRKQTNLEIYTSSAIKSDPLLPASAKKSDRIKSETSSTPQPTSSTYGLTSVGTKSHKKRELTVSEPPLPLGPSPKIVKTKKAKHIVPDDRKAYFAVVSLLIAQANSNPQMERITESNYMDFVDWNRHGDLLERLQGLLHYTL